MLVKPWACEPGPEYELPTSQDIFLSLSAFAYAFGGHGKLGLGLGLGLGVMVN